MFEPRDDAKPAVCLLGTAHLAGGAGQHMVETGLDDMLSARRQGEIADCVERLARFAPSKVAIEHPVQDQASVDADYRRYQAGDFALGADEDHQFGFRIAAGAGVNRIHAIDEQADDLAARDLGEIVAFSETHYPWLYRRLVDRIETEQRDSEAIAAMPMADLLRRWNDPAALRADHAMYLHLAQVRDGAAQVGVDWVQSWYARNLRIYANLMGLIESAEERVLAVYGVGHIPLLAQMLEDSGLVTVESPLTYLAG